MIKNHVYISSEARNHGLQNFDMKKQLDVDSANPATSSFASQTAHFSGFRSNHDIVAHEETDMIYVVGMSCLGKCRAGLWMLDVSDPANLEDVGSVGRDSYVQDF